MNYRRKSTDGWSIGCIHLDIIGGVFSILQMLINAYNHGKCWSIFNSWLHDIMLYTYTYEYLRAIYHVFLLIFIFCGSHLLRLKTIGRRLVGIQPKWDSAFSQCPLTFSSCCSIMSSTGNSFVVSFESC